MSYLSDHTTPWPLYSVSFHTTTSGTEASYISRLFPVEVIELATAILSPGNMSAEWDIGVKAWKRHFLVAMSSRSVPSDEEVRRSFEPPSTGLQSSSTRMASTYLSGI